jgi:hypothetical protein
VETKEAAVRGEPPGTLDRIEEWMMSRPHWTQIEGFILTALLNDEPDVRLDKILDIRRQLGEGRYNIKTRLDFVIGRILAELV